MSPRSCAQCARLALSLLVISLVSPARAADQHQMFSSLFLAFECGADTAVALVDLDVDGRLDAVSLSGQSAGVKVQLGQPDGTFGPPSGPPSGGFMDSAESMAIGDVDGDGFQDVVVPFSQSNLVGIHFGNGDGTLTNSVEFSVGDEPQAVALGDYDSDGDVDLAVTNRDDGSVSILRGPGDRTFPLRADYSAGTAPGQILAAELSGDTHLDLAFLDQDQEVRILQGDGAGAFFGLSTRQVGPDAVWISLADLDDDGNLDLLVVLSSSGSPSTLAVLPGLGGGAFGSTTLWALPDNSASIDVADVDGDGNLDVAVAAGFYVSILRGNGSGSFFPRIDTYADAAQAVAVGEVDGDGQQDLVVVGGLGNFLRLYSGNGNGTFGNVNAYGTTDSPVLARAADVTGDGDLDLVTADSGSEEPGQTGFVSVLPGNGNGTFSARTSYEAGLNPRGVAVATLDADAVLDIAVANSGLVERICGAEQTPSCCNPLGLLCPPAVQVPSTTLSVFLGTGGGSFGSSSDQIVGAQPRWVEAVDISGDGVEDLISANYGDGTISVLIGQGDGTFGIKTDYAMQFAGSRPAFIAVGDLNGDTVLDLAVSRNTETSVGLFFGTGGGSFGPVTPIATTDFAGRASIADFDEDGTQDLIVSGQFIALHRGNGDGTFQPAEDLGYAGSTTVADLNGDGHLDLMAIGNGRGFVSVLLGSGNGDIVASAHFGVGDAPVSTTVADVNADGRLDLLVPAFNEDRVHVLLNAGAPPVAAPLVSGSADGALASFPNPARTVSTVRFALPTGGSANLRVYDLAGRLVRALAEGPRAAGVHAVSWDLRSDGGDRVLPGVYFFELRTATGRAVGRTVVMED